MMRWEAQRVASAAGADLLRGTSVTTGPRRVAVDSRDVGPGVLFVGLPGERAHGGDFAAAALAAGAWGVLTDPAHADGVAGDREFAGPDGAVVLSADDPLVALQALATAWRRALGAAGTRVIGVTGSTGKTSTKDLLAALLGSQRRVFASRANFNTEIGLPLQLLSAPADTEVLVLEMGMRGPGQIAELAAIAEPDVGVIVSIGPVHLELLGSLEAIAAAKAELVAALAPGATAVLPAGEPLLAPHLRADLDTVLFGADGEVRLLAQSADRVEIDHRGERIGLEVNFTPAHLRTNLLAAVAAARAVGVMPAGRVELALSPGRGQRIELPDGVTLLDDAYNANPMSMRAALDELAAAGAGRRRIAVLGDMLELGPAERTFHREVGEHANGRADLLITVGPRAAAMAETFRGPSEHAADADAAARRVTELLGPGDIVLVKASHGVALARVCEALAAPA
ncbi:MAG TPA: UDP-N-acetylmuramoyl-tripeptide--D-alanyl-D-alanine ligase [Solirubrobacteraceae bacterium]|nr:UDP-N-acetylmuramoyl-tripeptide--D-alanyl-D-alanine ligase [Solirubrobacteraceae bacterium]